MIYLATNNGVLTINRNDNWHIARRGLKEKRVTAITARAGTLLAGTIDGIFRSDDDGKTWREASQGLTHRHIRWMASHPSISGLEFAGTEPASILISHDGGDLWQEIPEVAKLRDQHHWSMPYSPEAGCVRGFSFNGKRGFAAVEVGGTLRSDDNGNSWRLAEGSNGSPDFADPPAPFIHSDVHSIQIHPSSPDQVFAPTGRGFYRTTDGGKTWECLYYCYCRASWIDPDNPAHIILGPAQGVSTQGRIEESHDGGKIWQMASDGLIVPWSNNMVERFTQVGTELYAVLARGELTFSPLKGLKWQYVPEVSGVNAMAG
jgi:photosystem II stability/assembly factor-like uncharacterized protein